jgi:hypothetical protein
MRLVWMIPIAWIVVGCLAMAIRRASTGQRESEADVPELFALIAYGPATAIFYLTAGLMAGVDQASWLLSRVLRRFR